MILPRVDFYSDYFAGLDVFGHGFELCPGMKLVSGDPLYEHRALYFLKFVVVVRCRGQTWQEHDYFCDLSGVCSGHSEGDGATPVVTTEHNFFKV